jgi:hypothetical protein
LSADCLPIGASRELIIAPSFFTFPFAAGELAFLPGVLAERQNRMSCNMFHGCSIDDFKHWIARPDCAPNDIDMLKVDLFGRVYRQSATFVRLSEPYEVVCDDNVQQRPPNRPPSTYCLSGIRPGRYEVNYAVPIGLHNFAAGLANSANSAVTYGYMDFKLCDRLFPIPEPDHANDDYKNAVAADSDRFFVMRVKHQLEDDGGQQQQDGVEHQKQKQKQSTVTSVEVARMTMDTETGIKAYDFKEYDPRAHGGLYVMGVLRCALVLFISSQTHATHMVLFYTLPQDYRHHQAPVYPGGRQAVRFPHLQEGCIRTHHGMAAAGILEQHHLAAAWLTSWVLI